MSMYRKEWGCCGSITETEAWEPEDCPFCKKPLAQQAAAELRRLSSVEAQRIALLATLIKCRDRFFPADQPERDRDELWEPVNAAIKAVKEGK